MPRVKRSDQAERSRSRSRESSAKKISEARVLKQRKRKKRKIKRKDRINEEVKQRVAEQKAKELDINAVRALKRPRENAKNSHHRTKACAHAEDASKSQEFSWKSSLGH